MLNIFIRDYEWAHSKPRSIDDETLCDLLRIIEYQANRSSMMDDIGIEDKAAPDDALYMYVLDALGVPPEGEKKKFQGEHEVFAKECSFTREWFEELFYSKFILENKQYNLDFRDILSLIRNEANSDLRRHYQ